MGLSLGAASSFLLHEQVAEQARRTPDAIAIWSEEGEVSYGELEARANRLAHHLRRLGVGPESIVGLHVPRSIDMVVCVLGIWKAAGAYLPLDPEYPAERLRLSLADARADVLVTSGAVDAWWEWGGHRVVDLRRDAARIASEPDSPSDNGLTAEHLAYVIYTSGSTGSPKGVMVTHRAVANHLRWRQATYPLGAADAFLQKASLSFDISVWEIFAPLIAGARLVLARPGGQRDGGYLAGLIARQGVSIAHFGPTLLRLVLDAPELERCTSLRHVFCGGEVVPVSLCERLLARVPARLHHQYGPTEATIDASCWDCVPGETRSYVPMGAPVANTRLHVLDARGHLAAPGEVGELLIGGVGLARGYLRRPDLTAAAFVPDPFSEEPGARLYRTGDLVRRMPDGTLQFLGRRDHQVKVRGYRVELGEIEAALLGHPGLREAVVVVRGEGEDEHRLVAYVVPARNAVEPLELTALRAFLERSLPDYMVPAVFIPLDGLPLTPTGKVDRGALPEPSEFNRLVPSGLHEAPRGALEERLSRLWGEVLRVALPGRHAHFLELGGDSILAVRIAARLREAGYRCRPSQLFSHPTIAELAGGLRAALQELPDGGKASAVPEDEWPSSAASEPYPLTPMQEGMLFHTLLAPGSRVYHEQLEFELRGPLVPELIERAWCEVGARHPGLRMRFQWEGLSAPRQVEARELPPIEWWDWRSQESLAFEERRERFLAEDRARGFALTDAPPVRLSVVQLEDGRYWAVWSLHHLVFDGWSAALVLGELFATYAALRAGTRRELPPARPYRDFVRWIRSRDFSAEAPFWREALGPGVSPTPLFADRRPTRRVPEPDAALRLRLNAGRTARLKALAVRHRITLNTLLAGAWAVLLGRYSGQREVTFGLAVSGRSIELDGVEGIAGLLLNTLAVRVEVPSQATADGWLHTLQARLTELLAHEQTPLADVQRWCAGKPGEALFESLLVFENYPAEAACWSPPGAGLVVERRFGAARAPYALTLTARPGEALELWASYERDRFSDEVIHRLLRHLEQSLWALAEGSSKVLASLELLPADELSALLARGRGPRVALPDEAELPALFEAQAARTPETVAAMFHDERVTYRELDARANQLAHMLRGHGVGPEVRVGLCLPRSLELLVAVLGVLKTGGAYVPLDPDYPAERTAYVMADAGVAVLLTQSSVRGRLPAGQVRSILFDEVRAELAALPSTPPPRPVLSTRLAYVLYTSGSTGRPKGVMVTHQNVLNFLQSMRREPGLRPEDVVLALTSLSFDIAGLELFLPLAVGARVVIAPQAWQRDGALLAAGLTRCGASVLQATPATWQMLLQAGLPAGLGLRAFCGGEAMSRPLARALGEVAGSVWNLYGPTETTIWSAVERLQDEEADPSLGHAIDNTELYVLDTGGRPVPVGVAGELFIGGEGVARGYLGQPALTAERFVPDPFSARLGARLYRTGDLVRWREGGGLEFLGRIDHQVKVRGHRIELAEIETTLAGHPAVEQAVVVARVHAAEDVRLVAYFIPRTGQDGRNVQALRQWLSERLPGPMVPTVFVPLACFPLTPNGKVDRRALPAPDWGAAPRGAGAFVPPRSATERAVAELWRELLGGSAVSGVFDSFFTVGGHSLLAVRFAMRARTTFRVELSLQALLEQPTIAGMAAVIDAALERSPVPRGEAEVDPMADAVLPPGLEPRGTLPARPRPPRHLLLTGATGFVGAFLLKELLDRLPARIHCLIRAAGREEAGARLERKLRAYGLWEERFRERIEPVPGDLAEPGLGLSSAQLEALAGRVDAIYHCGAVVSFLYPYREMRAPNVQATQALLELACRGRPKVFHHVSTLSVFPPHLRQGGGLLAEDDAIEGATGFRTGYAQSKWVAERLVAQARSRGMQVAIYRLGNVTGHSQTGVWNTTDFVTRSLKSFIQLGSMPVLDGTLDLLPVDFVAKAIVHLSREPQSFGRTFHLSHPLPVSAGLLRGWLETLGYSLRSLSQTEWLDELRRETERRDHNALFALAPLIGAREAPGGAGPLQLFSSWGRVDHRNTRAGLEGSGIECPRVDESLFRTYFKYFVESGFLRAPGAQAPAHAGRGFTA
ncbi:non-ribosomal peptide synthetase [Myxococcus xanthus]|nr:non-ribosomal peptide synthetase [Myxococcus xanthus]QPM83400.1 non-ribosomal peptide synthetase [Myxococcus xanthus]QVW71964.1 non-ribosomal peptide synthetase [Myxococcus xanthus DZ2]UEO08555.1 non-ribosomal peptide synthetase [Myxococcus xanthus DZ2]